MECVNFGARNIPAMAAFPSPTKRLSGKRVTRWLHHDHSCLPTLRAGPSCRSMAVQEEFSNEEDYIKAGGSNLLFVQMQQKKSMENQSKIADKLSPISLEEDSVLDLVVIGCGPAGLSLAAESAKLGLRVGLIGPDLPFTNNYGAATVASGAASGKLLQYEVGGPSVSVQTAYGVEVEVENNPYDPSLMVFMDYRDYRKQPVRCLEAEYPTFLYAMPMSPTRVFFEETCLASKDAMPFELLKKKLMSRLDGMGVRVIKTYEEEWSCIPLGGSLPNTEHKNLAFGAAACMVHPTTGYSIVRSLSEAPKYASVIARILNQGINSKDTVAYERNIGNISIQAWNTLWLEERKRQRAFFLFGLALISQLDIEGIRTFFHTFFRLPSWTWQGFLGSALSSTDLILFAFYMFIIAPNNMKVCLIRHLLCDPTGASMIRTYLAL
ncbi:hypothetical protein NE237_025518 [Protea cynaroides]|uniref:Lycopene epsilon-cyclase n=1 Tax=Protea cynaroides TaxID=273540 RepID=A0A9Q0H6E1_9MAGN|nr:hypothetical protein NE237_025518 [Protea cynaroides]